MICVGKLKKHIIKPRKSSVKAYGMKRKFKRWEECSEILFISKELKIKSEYVAVGLERFYYPEYLSFVIGGSACETWLADTDGNHAVLWIFNDTKGRCNGNEFYTVFG